MEKKIMDGKPRWVIIDENENVTNRNPNQQKARLAEIVVRDHFKKHPVDLAGKNQNSPYDGICPNGMTYDVKSAGLDGNRWSFSIYNRYKDDIGIYFLLALKDRIRVGLDSIYELNIENMKEYEITEEIKEIINNTYIRSDDRSHNRRN